jgi:hypothetical protein
MLSFTSLFNSSEILDRAPRETVIQIVNLVFKASGYFGQRDIIRITEKFIFRPTEEYRKLLLSKLPSFYVRDHIDGLFSRSSSRCLDHSEVMILYAHLYMLADSDLDAHVKRNWRPLPTIKWKEREYMVTLNTFVNRYDVDVYTP